MSKLWKFTLLHLSFKNSWSYLILRNLGRENTWRTFYIAYMPSSFLEERWSERQLMTVSTVSSMKTSNSMELLNCLTSLLQSFLVLLCLLESNTSLSSKMWSFLCTRFRLVINSMNIWWDVRCFSLPKIHLWDYFCLMACWNIGLLPILPKKSCSFLSWLKFWKLAKFRNWNLTFQESSKD